MYSVPSIGMPIILSRWCKLSISVAIFNATNTDPNVDDSEYHRMGAPCRNIMIPVVDLLVIKSVACEASQNIFICLAFSLGGGAFDGIFSYLQVHH